MPNRDLKVTIDGDTGGFDAACTEAEAKARSLDRELAKLERQQDAEERVAAASALALKKYANAEDQAALSARKMGLEVRKAAENAERAQVRATAAAEAAAKGSFDKERAAKLAARADEAIERAAIKAAEAQLAAAAAAEKQAEKEKKVARAAELAAAAEHLAALRQVGDTKSYNSALQNLRKTHGDLKGTALEAFKEIENKGNAAYRGLTAAGESVAKAGPMWVVPAATAIANLPVIATLAGEGMSLALGGALSGLGLAAQAGTADVKRALTNLRTDVKGELVKISAPFHDTWLNIAADADHAFHELEPSLEGAFKEMAPAVTRFSAVMTSALSGPRVQAAITSIGHSFSAVLDDLGPAVGQGIGDIADGIKSISDAAAANPQALAGLVSGVGQITRYALEGVGALIRYKSQIEALVMLGTGGGPLGLYKLVGTLHDGAEALLGTDHGLQIAGGSFPSFAAKATLAAAGAGKLMTAEQAAALGADQLKTALDALTGKTLTEREALAEYRHSITAMTQSLKENGHAHGFATEKGAQNEQALNNIAKTAQTVAESMKAVGKDPAPYLEQARQQIVAMAEKMHYSAGQAEALANKLLGIKPVKLSVDDAAFVSKLHKAQGLKLDPKTGLLKGNNSDYFNKWLKAKGLRIDPKTGLFKGNNADYYNKWLTANHLKINTKTGKITGNTAAFWQAVNSIPSVVGHRTITVTYNTQGSGKITTPAQNRAEGGYVGYADGGSVPRRYPTGGGVFGPGTGTSDSIPAMLSNGEYVINARATAIYRPLLDAINYGRGRAPVAAASTLSGASGGSTGPAQVVQNNIFQAADPHVVARESAREMAWMLRG